MLNIGVLNVALGLAFVFGAVSLLVGSITEAIASVLSWRSKTLLVGIKKLLNDEQLQHLALGVYNHAAVNPMASGTVTAAQLQPTQGGPKPKPATLFGALPSYIDARNFASALIDVIQRRDQPGGFIADVAHAIDSVQDGQIKTVLNGFWAQSNQQVEALHQHIADWFDTAMDRLSGTYKRRTQLWNFCIALALVLPLGIDAFAVARHIYFDATIVAKLDLTQQATPSAMYEALAGAFPFGWSAVGGSVAIATAVIGCVVTAFATLFGAPFWFDTLQRFVQLRGTGPEPGVDPTKPK